MTPEDRALQALRSCRNWLAYRELLPGITEAIRKAILDEREQCAQLAEGQLIGNSDHDLACWGIARAIRTITRYPPESQPQ